MKTVIDAVNKFKGIWPYNGSLVMYFFSGVNGYGYYSNEADYNGVTAFTSEKFNKCVEEMTNMNIKPVYTQAMVDAGVMPSVGMECLINFPDIDYAWYEYTIDFMGKHTFIASCKDVSERFGHIEDVHIKPLDTRTDSERGFDKFLSDEYNSNIAEFQGSASDVDFITGLQSAWQAAIKFQLLEVKNND